MLSGLTFPDPREQHSEPRVSAAGSLPNSGAGTRGVGRGAFHYQWWKYSHRKRRERWKTRMANCEQVAMRLAESSETYLATFNTCTHEKPNMMHRNVVIWTSIVLNTPETTITSFGALWINMYRPGDISTHYRTESICMGKGKHATAKHALAVEGRFTVQRNHVSTYKKRRKDTETRETRSFLRRKQRSCRIT